MRNKEDKMIYSKSETIGVAEARNLLEITNVLKQQLTPAEFMAILHIYNGAADRILKENGVE